MEKVLGNMEENQKDATLMRENRTAILVTQTPEETRQIGCALGKGLMGGEVIALIGDLGSGKTSFVQGLALGLGIPPAEITSPTFTIIHEHQGRLPLVHVDLYRLERLEAIEALGVVDYFDEERVAVIEWAERAIPLLPSNVLYIRFIFLSSRERELHFEGRGGHYKDLVDPLIAKYKNYLGGEPDD